MKLQRGLDSQQKITLQTRLEMVLKKGLEDHASGGTRGGTRD